MDTRTSISFSSGGFNSRRLYQSHSTITIQVPRTWKNRQDLKYVVSPASSSDSSSTEIVEADATEFSFVSVRTAGPARSSPLRTQFRYLRGMIECEPLPRPDRTQLCITNSQK